MMECLWNYGNLFLVRYTMSVWKRLDLIFKKKKEYPLPFTDSKPNENMFDDLNLKNTRETGDNNE